MSYDKFGNKARTARARAEKANSMKSMIGVRDANKLTAIFAEITGYEKEATKLLAKTARAYYNLIAADETAYRLTAYRNFITVLFEPLV
jgi:cell division protein FtsB